MRTKAKDSDSATIHARPVVTALTGATPYRVVELPIEVVSEANSRGMKVRRGPAVISRTTIRRAQQREAIDLALPKNPCPIPCAVVFTRILGPGQRSFDGDNHAGAFKAVRDQVAAKLGVDDRDERVRWVYDPAEERGPAPGLRIEFWPVPQWVRVVL